MNPPVAVESAQVQTNYPKENYVAFAYLLTVKCTDTEFERFCRKFTNQFLLDDDRRFHGDNSRRNI